MTPRVLFICGTYNQTNQMLKIAAALPECEHWFSPHYADGVMGVLQRIGLLDFTTPGKPWVRRTTKMLQEQKVKIDYRGRKGPYDLVVLPTDLIVPKIVYTTPTVLVQEGMTDPETMIFKLIQHLRFLPRWLASSAAYGLSDAYDALCVASEGYRDLFVRKGVRPEKIRVTGIPNFDNCKRFLQNNLTQRNYVLVCTSDVRENYGFENRKAFIEQAVRIAAGRPLIFKLHPNENRKRASREIRCYAPKAHIIFSGSAEELVANCDVLITKWSSVTYVGMALGKEVHSDFPLDELKRLMPLQHAKAAEHIAAVCREVMHAEHIQSLSAPALEAAH
jgi:hypothetical protein